MKVIQTALMLCVASTQLGNAAGLERRNIDTDFLFADGMVVDLGVGSVSPSLPPAKVELFPLNLVRISRQAFQ